MILTTTLGDYRLDDSPLSPIQEQLILEDSNAMRGFVFPQETLPTHNQITYLQLFYYSIFCGAVMVEPVGTVKEHHLLLLTGNKMISRELCELGILYFIINQYTAITRVSNNPSYKYMHNFITNLGYESSQEHEHTIYNIPANWKPKTLRNVVVEF